MTSKTSKFILRLPNAAVTVTVELAMTKDTSERVEYLPDTCPAFIGEDAIHASRVLVQHLWLFPYQTHAYGVSPELQKSLFNAACAGLASENGLDIYLQETIAACRLLVIKGRGGDADVARALAFLETPLRVLGIPEAYTYSETPLSFSTTLQDMVK